MKEQDRTCVEYRATIYQARIIKRGSHGEVLDPPIFEFREKRGKDGNFSRVEGASQWTEDVMLGLFRSLRQQNPPKYIAVSVHIVLHCNVLRISAHRVK